MHKSHPGLYQAFVLSPTCDDLDLAGQRWTPKVCILGCIFPTLTHPCRQPQLERLGRLVRERGYSPTSPGPHPPIPAAESPECTDSCPPMLRVGRDRPEARGFSKAASDICFSPSPQADRRGDSGPWDFNTHYRCFFWIEKKNDNNKTTKRPKKPPKSNKKQKRRQRMCHMCGKTQGHSSCPGIPVQPRP